MLLNHLDVHRNHSPALITIINHPALGRGCGKFPGLGSWRGWRGGCGDSGGAPLEGPHWSLLQQWLSSSAALREGNPCPGTPCKGKCQLLDAGTVAVCPGLYKLGFWREDESSWATRPCRECGVFTTPEGAVGLHAEGPDMGTGQRPSVVQKKPCLAFLQGSRYFAPGRWCYVFLVTDKVKPLIWLKI